MLIVLSTHIKFVTLEAMKQSINIMMVGELIYLSSDEDFEIYLMKIISSHCYYKHLKMYQPSLLAVIIIYQPLHSSPTL